MIVTPVTIYLIRHATDVSEFSERFSEERLTTEGEDQALRIAEMLSSRQLTKIYSSPALPATQTAEKIAESTGVGVTIDERIRGRDLGQADGMTYKQVRERFGNILSEDMFNANWGFPEGEVNGEIYGRTNSFAQTLIQLSSGRKERIAVISHNMVLNFLIYNFQGLGYQDRMFYLMEGGSFAVLERSQTQFGMRYLGKV